MTAPTVRASSQNSSGSAGTTATGNKPTGTADGDCLLACVLNGGGTTAPAGWAQVVADTQIQSSGRFFSVWSKTASSEGASWGWTQTSTSRWIVEVVAVQDADQTTPLVANNQQTNASSIHAIAPAITPGVANTLLIGFFGVFYAASQASSWTPATGQTELNDLSLNGATSNSMEAAWEALSGSGSTGTRSATVSNAGVNFGWLGAVQGVIALLDSPFFWSM